MIYVGRDTLFKLYKYNILGTPHTTLLEDIYSKLYAYNAMETLYAAAPGHLFSYIL